MLDEREEDNGPFWPSSVVPSPQTERAWWERWTRGVRGGVSGAGTRATG